MASFSWSPYFSTLAALMLLSLLFGAPNGTEAQSAGVCYGMNGDNLPPPSQVIGLLQSKNIRKVRLYEPRPDALQALRNSGIEVNLAVPNSDIQSIASDPSSAGSWVASNIQAYPGVMFRCITVGNELIPGPQAQSVLPAMQNILNAIRGAGLGDQITVSTVVSTSVTSGFPPSAGVFTPEASPFMVPIVQFLAASSAPLMVTVYPYFSYAQNGPSIIPLDYALFTANRDVVIDGNLRYRNLFDAMLDTVYSAIDKVVPSAMDKTASLDAQRRTYIHVTESGWPSAGGTDVTTASYASTYNQNLVNHVAQGTPKTSGTPIPTYVFALFNENLKQGPQIERNFGLFYPNMQPVYGVNFP